jgi:hypothetical protein
MKVAVFSFYSLYSTDSRNVTGFALSDLEGKHILASHLYFFKNEFPNNVEFYVIFLTAL